MSENDSRGNNDENFHNTSKDNGDVNDVMDEIGQHHGLDKVSENDSSSNNSNASDFDYINVTSDGVNQEKEEKIKRMMVLQVPLMQVVLMARILTQPRVKVDQVVMKRNFPLFVIKI